jgi:hypothetical protein
MSTQRTPRRRTLAAEGLEQRLCLSVSTGWDGPGKGQAVLTYYIANAPSSLSPAAVHAAIRTALDAWSAVVDVTFIETDVPRQPDSIDIRFGRIDGVGRVLAETFLPDDVNPPLLAGDVTFDASERWEVGNARGSSAFDLVQIAVHELGHALGLEHSRVPGAVMYPTVSPNVRFTGLTPNDIRAAQSLYAARSSTTAPTAPNPSPSTPSDPDASPTKPTLPRFPRFPRWPRFGGRRIELERTFAAR